MRLSEHLTLEECIYSDTAKRFGIDNTPSPEIINKLSIMARVIFEPLRKIVMQPITVTSGYRCPELETAISGRVYGQHVLGEALDLQCKDITAAQLYNTIKLQLDFPYGQCILERVKGAEWVHVSMGSKRQNLLAYEYEGQIKYKEDDAADHAAHLS